MNTGSSIGAFHFVGLELVLLSGMGFIFF
jgi:hypothetical protein